MKKFLSFLLILFSGIVFSGEHPPVQKIILSQTLDTQSIQATLYEALVKLSQEDKSSVSITTSSQSDISFTKIVLTDGYNRIECLLEEANGSRLYSTVIVADNISFYPLHEWSSYSRCLQALLHRALTAVLLARDSKVTSEIQLSGHGIIFRVEQALMHWRLVIEKTVSSEKKMVEIPRVLGFVCVHPQIRKALTEALHEADIKNPLLSYDIEQKETGQETVVLLKLILRDDIVSVNSKFIQCMIRLKKSMGSFILEDVFPLLIEPIQRLDRSLLKTMDVDLSLIFLNPKFGEKITELADSKKEWAVSEVVKLMPSESQRKRGIGVIYQIELHPLGRFLDEKISFQIGLDSPREGMPKWIGIDMVEVSEFLLRSSAEEALLKIVTKLNRVSIEPLQEAEVDFFSSRFSLDWLEEVGKKKHLFSPAYNKETDSFVEVRGEDIEILRMSFKHVARSMGWEEGNITPFLEHAKSDFFKELPGVFSRRLTSPRVARLLGKQLRSYFLNSLEKHPSF